MVGDGIRIDPFGFNRHYLDSDSRVGSPVIERAAKKMSVSIRQLFEEAFVWWYGRQPEDEIIDIYLREYRKESLAAPWVLRYAGNLLDEKVVPFSNRAKSRKSRKRR